ncbi:MAG: 50S ribosome-binding GTPase, partial [Bacteroidota bacterium]|nr:50S ribosome-binding GTPase [Bacteroidota bacterium]
MKKQLHIALVGNPNSGKTSLFNSLTGLNQKVGNFPGVTVDKKTGTSKISDKLTARIIDLPVMYSLYPKRSDEWVSYKVLIDEDADTKADIILLVADASNLKRNLLFCSQVIDLKRPVVIALTMMDIAKNKNIQVDVAGLERELGVLVIPVNPRKNKGFTELNKALEDTALNPGHIVDRDFIKSISLAPEAISKVQQLLPEISDYRAVHYLINHENFSLNSSMQEAIENIEAETGFNATKTQAEEILKRYGKIKTIKQQTVIEIDPRQKALFTQKLDDVL